VIRALEYYEATGRPISERRLRGPKTPYETLLIGITWNRQVLEDRIDNRVETQFEKGFVAEVQGLLAKGYREDLPSMQGLGYKEVCLYLKGLATIQETKRVLKRNTRRFCKRQFTWFSRETGMNWIAAGKDTGWNSTVDAAYGLCENWLKNN
jgi:tRNA dimethylallyltransferase